jgi:predicted anti-sigma-YlaC factor YlaD
MTCREVADFLLDYSAGELPDVTHHAFEHHLARCANCREYLALYLTSLEFARRAFDNDDASAVRAGVPEDLVVAIMSARHGNS